MARQIGSPFSLAGGNAPLRTLPSREVVRIAASLVAGLLSGLVAAMAVAQGDYPVRPVHLVVPFAPGGSTDVVARLLAAKLSDAFGQQVVVENRPGAGATLATEQVSRASADGYTVLMTAFPSITTGPLTNANVHYDALRDFTHIALVGTFPNGFVVRADSPLKSLSDFIAYARANPGKVSYGSAGPGSAGHLTGELLKQLAGIDMVHIPYKGAGPAFVDLLAGQTMAVFDGMLNAASQARAGKVRVLAVSSAERLPSYPEIPTLDETVKGAIGVSWFGVAAPAGLPHPIAARLEIEVLRALANPEVRSRLEETGMTVLALDSADCVAFIQQDIRKWAPVLKRVKLE
jgi:tripartite-type tricarboxylate transporter receptor subunit TctC